jgi:predicted glycoside hydrolase/deacetylase ChbG (UPF0249 family)
VARGEEIRLIIRGDDLGMTQGSLVAVERCFHEGVLTCTSLLVPGPWFEAAAELCKKNPRWCVGVHLCLFGEWTGYRWRPVRPWDKVPSLVDEHGFLFQHPRDLFAKKPKLAEIDAEFRAQIELAKRKGVSVRYLDAHMLDLSDRTYPGLGALVEKLSRDYDLPVSTHLGERHVAMAPEPLETRPQRALKTVDGLTPGLWLWVEHPGIDSPEQMALRVPFDDTRPPGWIGRERVMVTATFTSPELKALIAKKGIKLTDYHAVWEERKSR